MEQELSLLIVFVAGFLSFLSPCVLPLIPGYIAFVSGVSIDDMTEDGSTDRDMASAMLSSAMFVLGFSVVFVLLGVSATWLGGVLVQRLPLLKSIAGVVIIIFGLQQIGLFKFGFMLTTKQIDLPTEKLGPFKAPLLGAAFAFGWDTLRWAYSCRDIDLRRHHEYSGQGSVAVDRKGNDPPN